MDFLKKSTLFLGRTAVKVFDIFIGIAIPEDKKLDEFTGIDFDELTRSIPRSDLVKKDVISLFSYQNPKTKSLLIALKYKNHPFARKFFAKVVYQELLEILSDINMFYGSDAIVLPMPMSKKEQQERGFNPMVELLKEVNKHKDINIKYDILKKIRDTEKQNKLSRDLRLKNIIGAMDADIDKKRLFVVVDDVYTTGATFDESRRALLGRGGIHVFGLFLAH